MSFNFGAFAGGVGTGYMASKEQQRKDAEEKRRQSEYEREDAYRKEMEGITSPDDAHKVKLAEYEKKKQTEIEASTAAKVVGNPIVARGITTAPTSSMSAASFGESMEPRSEGNPLAPSRPVSTPSSIIAANGIGASNVMRQEIAKPEQAAPLEAPKAPGINDWLDFATKRAAIDVKHGKLNGLGMMQLAQARKQLMDEGVDEAVMKFQQGDATGGLESFNASGKYIGAKLVGEPQRSEFDYNGVKMPTTIVTLKLPDGRTETINTAQYGTSRIKAENQFSAAMDMLKHEQTGKHQDKTLKEASRHNVASEGIARTKAAEGTEATTAEIKNVNFLIKNGIAKDAKQGWEMVKTGRTPTGEHVVSDGRGGAMVIDRDNGKVSKLDRSGKEVVLRQPRLDTQPDAAGVAPVPGARKAPDGKWYVQKDGKTYLVE